LLMAARSDKSHRCLIRCVKCNWDWSFTF